MHLPEPIPTGRINGSTPMGLRAPTDVHLAHRIFGANCGPATLAAVLSVQVCDVIALFDQFPDRPYTSRRKMEEILQVCRLGFSVQDDFPTFGLALVQFDGPWTGVPGAERWAGRFTHWIGVAGDAVYDVNCDGWVSRWEWETETVKGLIAGYRRATGWSVRKALEVALADFSPDEVLPGFRFGRGSYVPSCGCMR